jgi:hypothetical protein
MLVLAASRDAGYGVISKEKVVYVMWDLRDSGNPYVPGLMFSTSGDRRFCRALEDALAGLHRHGAPLNPITGAIEVMDSLSCAEIYKPLHDVVREELFVGIAPYLSEFVRQVSWYYPEKPEDPIPSMF